MISHRFVLLLWALLALLFAAACETPSFPKRPTPRDATPSEREPVLPSEDALQVSRARERLEAGELDAARDLAADVQLARLDEGQRLDAIRLFADIALAAEEPVDALRWLSLYRDRGEGDARAATEREIDALFSPQSTQTLVAAAETLGGRSPAAEIWLEIARREIEAGQRDRAEIALERLRPLRLRAEQEERAEALAAGLGGEREGRDARFAGSLPPPLSELRQDAPAGYSAGGTIGVVLPLSGPVAQVAEETLQGVLLATGSFNQGARGRRRGGVEVVVHDTGGDPARAAQAVRDLAARGDVLGAIGPLLPEEVQAAAGEADRNNLPLITLTRRESVAAARASVFRIGLTRAAEAESLVEHAVGRLGIRRVAILYPRDEYGEEFRTLLWLALERAGAEVVGVSGYDPESTDFADSIRSLVGFDFMSGEARSLLQRRDRLLDRAKRLGPEDAKAMREKARGLRLAGGDPLPPIVDFDAIFIPDAHDKVGLIAPQLAFHRIRGPRLFGSSGWHHPDLVPIAGRHVEGAFFTSGFDAKYPSPMIQEFARRFRGNFEQPATTFAAQGFDAANLLQLQLMRGSTTPSDVRRALLATSVYPGVSGAMAFGPDGNITRRPFLVGVRRGETQPID